jgi:hypothetical protein
MTVKCESYNMNLKLQAMSCRKMYSLLLNYAIRRDNLNSDSGWLFCLQRNIYCLPQTSASLFLLQSGKDMFLRNRNLILSQLLKQKYWSCSSLSLSLSLSLSPLHPVHWLVFILTYKKSSYDVNERDDRYIGKLGQ